MAEYRPRMIDAQLRRELDAMGAVLIVGPKWCGKTTSAQRIARSALYMQDTDNSDRYLQLAEVRPSLLLEGEKPRLIDEWQMAPRLWDAVRFSVDREGGRGMYILTGSTVVDEGSIMHSGTGRIARLRMRTMSLYESGDSDGSVSLGGLFDGGTVEGISPLGLEDVAGLIVRGGWPGTIGCDEDVTRINVKNYCESMIMTEVGIDGVRHRDPQRMRAILRSISRNSASQVPDTRILDDLTPVDGDAPMHINTLRGYLRTLESLFVTEDLTAWTPRLRSRTSVKAAPTRHLSDPAMAAYFLGASPRDLMYDPETFGLLFETLVVRDLRIYAQAVDGDVYHYRDRNGLECDAIVHLHDGRWGAMVVKLNPAREDEAARNLLRLADAVDTERMGAPSFLAVVCATGYAYTRADGVHVIPIGCLRDRGLGRSRPPAGTSCRGSSR